MSLSRLALRLAAMEALCPHASLTSGRFPTLAGDRVYDSRIDAIEALSLEEKGHPIIVVYTETNTSSPYEGSKHRPNEHFVDLVVEASIAAAATIEVLQADGTTVTEGAIETPVTDRKTEALLDVHEALIRRVFDRGAAVGSAALFFSTAMEVRTVDSEPLRDSDKTTRLAQRTIRFQCKVKGEAWVSPSLSPVTATGLDRLPEPLQTVAKGLPDGSTGRAVCEGLTGLIPEADGLAQFTGIDIFIGVNREPTASEFDVRAAHP